MERAVVGDRKYGRKPAVSLIVSSFVKKKMK